MLVMKVLEGRWLKVQKGVRRWNRHEFLMAQMVLRKMNPLTIIMDSSVADVK